MNLKYLGGLLCLLLLFGCTLVVGDVAPQYFVMDQYGAPSPVGPDDYYVMYNVTNSSTFNAAEYNATIVDYYNTSPGNYTIVYYINTTQHPDKTVVGNYTTFKDFINPSASATLSETTNVSPLIQIIDTTMMLPFGMPIMTPILIVIMLLVMGMVRGRTALLLGIFVYWLMIFLGYGQYMGVWGVLFLVVSTSLYLFTVLDWRPRSLYSYDEDSSSGVTTTSTRSEPEPQQNVRHELDSILDNPARLTSTNVPLQPETEVHKTDHETPVRKSRWEQLE